MQEVEMEFVLRNEIFISSGSVPADFVGILQRNFHSMVVSVLILGLVKYRRR